MPCRARTQNSDPPVSTDCVWGRLSGLCRFGCAGVLFSQTEESKLTLFFHPVIVRGDCVRHTTEACEVVFVIGWRGLSRSRLCPCQGQSADNLTRFCLSRCRNGSEYVHLVYYHDMFHDMFVFSPNLDGFMAPKMKHRLCKTHDRFRNLKAKSPPYRLIQA
jgi:hypothetical protein